MPLVVCSDLPTFKRLMDEHHKVLSFDKATHQDIRELHVGLLNMMPDAALEATERQFMRLVGDCNQIAQFYIHPFTLPSIDRSDTTQEWIDKYYENFETVKSHGLDALIISGANPDSDSLEQECFWDELTEVIDWSKDNVTSTLCACLATHVVVQYLYNIKRKPLNDKKWGVYSHRLTQPQHPLVRHMNTCFDVPHSRSNEVTKAQLEEKGLQVLVESKEAGIHLAVSHDGIRQVFLQGHPEYEYFSLLKEYKREIDRWYCGKRKEYPPFPENYFDELVKGQLKIYQKEIVEAKNNKVQSPIWPEEWLSEKLDNTWRDTALSLFNNWLGLVYQLTDRNLKIPFMLGVDPKEPLKKL